MLPEKLNWFADLTSRKFHFSFFILVIITLLVTGCTQAATRTPVSEATPMAGLPPTAGLSPATAEETQPTVAELIPCSQANQVSLIQTPVSVTPTTTSAGPSASPTPVSEATSTPTPRPAPQEDRVGFPENYQDEFNVMYIIDRLDNKQVRVICGNQAATSVQSGAPFPYGSILVMETWRAKVDAAGNVVKDESGHLIRESLSGIFVMRKEPGFGEAYQGLRTGEWEYVAYRPDGSHSVPPQNSANCAACHLGSSEDKDWVFRADVLFFDEDRYEASTPVGENEVSMTSISFFPRTLEVKVGTTVTWTNHDMVAHTVTADDESLNSGSLDPGDSFSFTFDKAGVFEYHCSHHPEQMKAMIEVTE